MSRLDPDSDYAYDETNRPDPPHILELRKARGIVPTSPQIVDRSSIADGSEAVSASAAPDEDYEPDLNGTSAGELMDAAYKIDRSQR